MNLASTSSKKVNTYTGCVYMCMCVWVYMCMCIYVYVCMCVNNQKLGFLATELKRALSDHLCLKTDTRPAYTVAQRASAKTDFAQSHFVFDRLIKSHINSALTSRLTHPQVAHSAQTSCLLNSKHQNNEKSTNSAYKQYNEPELRSQPTLRMAVLAPLIISSCLHHGQSSVKIL